MVGEEESDVYDWSVWHPRPSLYILKQSITYLGVVQGFRYSLSVVHTTQQEVSHIFANVTITSVLPILRFYNRCI